MEQQLLLHVGLPKTGSSALQAWCSFNRAKLLEAGITYPLAETISAAPDKHQFLVQGLMRRDLSTVQKAIDSSTASKILFSAEGLSNHLYDFPESSLSMFRSIASNHEVRIFVVLRDVSCWTRSYYKQAVVNPPMAEYDYATPLKLPSFAELPRTRRLIDTAQLVEDLSAAFGSKGMVTARYEEDWLDSFVDFLGLEQSLGAMSLDNCNESCSDAIVELARQLNAMRLTPQERSHCLWLIGKTAAGNHEILRRYRPLPSQDPRRAVASSAINALNPQSAAQQLIVEEVLTLALPEPQR